MQHVIHYPLSSWQKSLLIDKNTNTKLKDTKGFVKNKKGDDDQNK